MLDPAFVRTAREAPLLAPAEERDLIIRAQTGDQKARDALLTAHYRVVIQQAAKRRGYKVPIADMVQEGIVGMSEALKRFDPAHPVRFSTYATWWVRSAMNDAALREHSLVRRNTTQKDKALFFSLRKARAAIERDGKLTDHEINAELASRFDTSIPEIAEMTAYLVQGDKPLNAPVHFHESDETDEAIDRLVDPSALPDEVAEAHVDGDRLRRAIHRALDQLDERERLIVVARRYTTEDTKTLEELADELSLSRERVRQIEERALRKLGGFLRAEGIGPGDIA